MYPYGAVTSLSPEVGYLRYMPSAAISLPLSSALSTLTTSMVLVCVVKRMTTFAVCLLPEVTLHVLATIGNAQVLRVAARSVRTRRPTFARRICIVALVVDHSIRWEIDPEEHEHSSMSELHVTRSDSDPAVALGLATKPRPALVWSSDIDLVPEP